MAREKMFSLNKDDFVRQTFRCGGKGGQNVNKVETGVRFIHPPSGAVGEGREHRTQKQNEEAAFKRMATTPEFQKWVRVEIARISGVAARIEAEVEEAMHPQNLKIEVQRDGRWVNDNESLGEETLRTRNADLAKRVKRRNEYED